MEINCERQKNDRKINFYSKTSDFLAYISMSNVLYYKH